ncbi:HIT family protein [Streptomyces fumanus]|uniref:HIT family protein n=1 Tax=Streptomyces fumanus TaxID=67302 RepID=UPI0033CCD871
MKIFAGTEWGRGVAAALRRFGRYVFRSVRPERWLTIDRRRVTAVDSRSRPGASCIFCAFEEPDVNRVMDENKTCYIRYDNFPATQGHVEIVPKRHIESFFELTPEEVQDAYALMLVARERITQQYHPDGFTIGVNEGRAAGRTVDHLHIHVIPRRYGDVEDPRGGIRRAVPNCDPDAWVNESTEGKSAARRFAARAGSSR